MNVGNEQNRYMKFLSLFRICYRDISLHYELRKQGIFR